MSEGMPMAGEVSSRVAREMVLFRRLMRWCIGNARRQVRSGNLDLALGWTRWAALLFCDQRCGELTSPALERTLTLIGRRLPIPAPAPRRTGPRRWLHVFTYWEAIGGHTAFALRWLRADAGGEVHSIALIEQEGDLPAEVLSSTEATGGQIHRLECELSSVQRAEQLRRLAWRDYDVVVLHLHQYDVISPAAFAVPGGPPVLLVNGADHMFWTGAGVTDLALHIRPLAQEWSARYRGLPRGCVLPIPLPQREPATDSQRALARAQLGLPPDACILLSIGSDWKFAPMAGIDFTRLAEQVLRISPSVYLVVVGPNPQSACWHEAVQRGGGRLIVHAATPNLQPLHHAADIYLDSMPHGSLTALLEVAMLGVPCMLQPRSCPYPLYPDDGAQVVLPRPADFEDYLRLLRQWVIDPKQRRQQGEVLANSVRSQHCGEGWRSLLASVKATLPAVHRVWPVNPQESVPDSYLRFWNEFLGPHKSEDFLRFVIEHPVRTGLGLGMDRHLWKAIVGECMRLHPAQGLRVFDAILTSTPKLRETSLYVDGGHGFSETDRLRVDALLDGPRFQLAFDLSAYPSIHALRWDPVETCCCKVRLDSVAYHLESGEKVVCDLSDLASNGTVLPERVHLFATHDSMFFLPISGRVAKVILEGQWWGPLSEAEVIASSAVALGSNVPAASGAKVHLGRILRKTHPLSMLRYARRLLKRRA